MFRRLTLTLSSALLIAMLVLAPGTATAAAASEVEMTEQEAGDYFLEKLCDANAGIEAFNDRVFGQRDSISSAGVRRRLPELKRLIGRLAISEYNFARALRNAPGLWPSSVAGPIATTKTQLLKISRFYRAAASAATGRRWSVLSNKGDDVRVPTDTIRFRLNLPAPGEGC